MHFVPVTRLRVLFVEASFQCLLLGHPESTPPLQMLPRREGFPFKASKSGNGVWRYEEWAIMMRGASPQSKFLRPVHAPDVNQHLKKSYIYLGDFPCLLFMKLD